MAKSASQRIKGAKPVAASGAGASISPETVLRELYGNLGKDANFLSDYFVRLFLRFNQWEGSDGYSNADLAEIIEFFTMYPYCRATIGECEQNPIALILLTGEDRVRGEAYLHLNQTYVVATKILEREASQRGMDPFHFHRRAEVTREIMARRPLPTTIDVEKLPKDVRRIFQKNDADLVRLKAAIAGGTQSGPVLEEVDLVILRELAKYPHCIKLVDITTDYDRHRVSDRLHFLHEIGFVDWPSKTRKGAAIAAKGREYLATTKPPQGRH